MEILCSIFHIFELQNKLRQEIIYIEFELIKLKFPYIQCLKLRDLPWDHLPKCGKIRAFLFAMFLVNQSHSSLPLHPSDPISTPCYHQRTGKVHIQAAFFPLWIVQSYVRFKYNITEIDTDETNVFSRPGPLQNAQLTLTL